MLKRTLAFLLMVFILAPLPAGAINYKGGLEANESVLLPEQASTPANPAATKHKLYIKTDGDAYTLDSAGVESPVTKGALEATESVTLPEQASTPANPASGKRKVYVKTDGQFYRLDSGGTETRVGFPTAIVDADISQAEGFLRKTGAGAYEGIKSNLGATVDPTGNEDSGDGYAVGSVWINVTLDKVFQASDVTVAAAVWKDLSGVGGTGSLVLLATATASASATIDFDAGLDWTTYDKYIFEVIAAIPATDDSELWLRTSTDNGTSYDSGASNYHYGWVQTASNSTTLIVGTSIGDTAIKIGQTAAGAGFGNAAGESLNGIIILHKPSDMGLNSQLKYTLNMIRANSSIGHIDGAGSRKSAADVDGFRFLMSTGNITSGTFKMYGVL